VVEDLEKLNIDEMKSELASPNISKNFNIEKKLTNGSISSGKKTL
jgi:hypothetical protein